MKILLSSVVICVLLALPTSAALAIERKVDFEIAFLADNFGAVRLPYPRAVRAGDIFSINRHLIGSYRNTLETCVTDFSRRYIRSPVSFRTSSTHNSRSFQLTANVRHLYSLSGQVNIKVTSIIDESSISVESDAVRVETDLASSIIPANANCHDYYTSYSMNLSPRGTILVENAYFLSGQVSHEYSIELSGQGTGQIGGSQLSNFVNDVLMVSQLVNVAVPTASLSVNGQSVNSESILFDYPEDRAFAIGVRPMGVNARAAAELISVVQELELNNIHLNRSAKSAENAEIFLNDYPQFNLDEENTLIRRVYGNPDQSYTHFRQNDPSVAHMLADIVSRIVAINCVAQRNQGPRCDSNYPRFGG